MGVRELDFELYGSGVDKLQATWSRRIRRLVISDTIYILSIGNHTVFLVQFGVNLHLGVFQKAEIARAASASVISAF